MEKHTLIGKWIIAFMLFVGTVNPLYGQRSLYKDNKATEVGDIITVILQENISGSTNSDSQNSSDASTGAEGSLGGNFMPFKPTFGGDTKVNYESGEKMSTNQEQLLKGNMSVEVVDKTSSGNLVVEGSRSTKINGEKHHIDVNGMVRPKDINGRNQVLSYRLANAEINYEKDEGADRITKKKGFIKRVALTVVGIAVTAAAVMKAKN